MLRFDHRVHLFLGLFVALCAGSLAAAGLAVAIREGKTFLEISIWATLLAIAVASWFALMSQARRR